MTLLRLNATLLSAQILPVKTWAKGAGVSQYGPWGKDAVRICSPLGRPGPLPPASFFSDAESTAPGYVSLAIEVWSFAACSASVRPEASEPKEDRAHDDFSIPADPPEVGVKR